MKLPTNLDSDGMNTKFFIFTVKDLRNAIAHNNVIFDTRFKSGKIDQRLVTLLETEVGISNIDFKYMDAYIIKEVCIEWQNYQNFKIWFDTHYIPGTKVNLDKDLLYKEGNIYSPETCAFMTHFLNTVFEDRGIESNIQQNDNGTYLVSMNVLNRKMDIGVFDSEEEAHTGFIDGKIDYICDLAEKCKGKVPDYVYEGMLNYKIEID